VPPESVTPASVGAADGNYDGFYVDPQFTDRPNGSFDDAVSGTVVYYLSGGEPDFEAAAGRAFDNTGGIENYVLGVGESMDFGLFIETEKNGVEEDFDGEIALNLKADASVVPDSES